MVSPIIETCSNCVHWRPMEDTLPQQGDCRRFPPKVMPMSSSKIAVPNNADGATGFAVIIIPRLTSGDYDCGEWEFIGPDARPPMENPLETH